MLRYPCYTHGLLSFIAASERDVYAICMGFLVDVEISLLYAWVLNLIARDVYAMCIVFLLYVEISLLYA